MQIAYYRIVLLFMFMAVVAHAQQTAEKSTTAVTEAKKAVPTDRPAQLVKEWTRAKLGAQEYIDAMPEESIGFKPTPEIRSFAEQWLHIASAQYLFASTASGKENPYDAEKGKDIEKMEEPKKNKAALRKLVLDSYDYIIEAARSMTLQNMDQPIKFFKSEMPRSLVLAKALEHHAHHRGQTTIYLRLKGIKPPSERLF
jgi:uncharacterized damage-inducible protein DinB